MTEIARQPQGVPTGGQFAATNHAESTVSLEVPPDGPVDAAINAVRNGDEKFDLIFVDRDDKLSDSDMGLYLAGEFSELDESIWESYADHRYDHLEEDMRKAFEEAGIDESELNDEQRDAMREVISDKDTSDPLPDLLRNSGDKLMRVSIATPEPGYQSGHTEGVGEARVARISELLTDKGMDVTSPEAQEAIGELVDNGPWDWHEAVDLDVIYYADPRESTVWNGDAGEACSRDLSFTDPHVLLIDRMNGSGHEVKIPGTVKVTATPDKPVRLDAAKDNGYGWDDVAGVYHSGYRCEPESTWVEPEADPEDNASTEAAGDQS